MAMVLMINQDESNRIEDASNTRHLFSALQKMVFLL